MAHAHVADAAQAERPQRRQQLPPRRAQRRCRTRRHRHLAATEPAVAAEPAGAAALTAAASEALSPLLL